MPEARTLHRDATLSNLSVLYQNDAMIWRSVLPVVRVKKRSDYYTVYNKEDSYTLADDTIGPRSLPNEVDWGVSQANYSVKDHAFGDYVAVEAIDNADTPIDPLVRTNAFLNLLLDIAQERRVANLVFAAANYPTGNKVQLSGTSQWGQSADNPIGNLLTAIETCFMRANTVVMGADAWMVFRALPEVLDAVKGSSRYQGSPGGLATVEECRGLFEVDNWLVGRARYNTAKKGQTASYARLWGKHCAALYVDPNPGVDGISWGVTFSESERATYTEFDGKRGVKGAHFVKVAWNSDEKVVASDVGYFIQDAVA